MSNRLKTLRLANLRTRHTTWYLLVALEPAKPILRRLWLFTLSNISNTRAVFLMRLTLSIYSSKNRVKINKAAWLNGYNMSTSLSLTSWAISRFLNLAALCCFILLANFTNKPVSSLPPTYILENGEKSLVMPKWLPRCSTEWRIIAQLLKLKMNHIDLSKRGFA